MNVNYNCNINQPRVLHIGIVKDGKIIREQIFKPREDVYIGKSLKNTFIFEDLPLHRSKFPLFVNKNGVYYFHSSPEMSGKIKIGKKIIQLSELHLHPSTIKCSNMLKLSISDQDKGKIKIGDLSILFRFVPLPPESIALSFNQIDFRPRLFDGGDVSFAGFLTLFGALAIVFSMFVYFSQPIEIRTEFVEIHERFAFLLQKKKEKTEILPVEDHFISDFKEKKKESTKVEEKMESKKSKDKLAEAREYEARKEKLRNEMIVFRPIGTRGKSNNGTTVEIGDGDLLNNLDSEDLIAGTNLDGLRKANVDISDRTIEGIETSGAKATNGSSGPLIDMSKYKVQSEEPDLTDMEGIDNIESVLRKLAGSLNYCYEKELRADPTLSGRIEVRLAISSGRVTSINTISNTTRNEELALCMAKKIKRWRFAKHVRGTANWPFFFRKK